MILALPPRPAPVAPKPVILRVTPLVAAKVNVPVDVRVDLRASYADAFDPEQVALDVKVTAPGGTVSTMPGFAYREYRRAVAGATLPVAYNSTEKLAQGATVKERFYEKAEVLHPVGKSEWRVRLAFPKPGRYTLAFSIRDKTGTGTKRAAIEVRAGAAPGYVRVDPRDPTSFRLSTGASVFPIGCNLGWAGEKGLADYERWIPRYAKAGADWGRIWMGPGWTTFALQRDRLNAFDLGNAWRLDRALDLARANGMRLNLAFDSYNTLRDRINWPEWERSAYNRANGGPLAKPAEFWSDARARKAYRARLRYIVARWGADPAVFAWEFWNEADGVTDYAVEPVRAWHAEMGRYLRSIDPYRHLVSTSFGGSGRNAGDESVFALKEMDFSTAHLYNEPDLALATVEATRRLGALGKPFFVGEIGADAAGARIEDKEGLQLHDPLWSSLAGNASGGAMLWWWDSYVDPLGLERLYTPAREFLKGVDRGAEGFRSVDPKVTWVSPPAAPTRRDLILIGGPQSWNAAPYNAPRRVAITPAGATMEGGPLSALLQGKGNHAELHNPVTFATDLPRATTLVLEAQEISGWGGAGLTVTLDGATVLAKEFADPDGDRLTESLTQFAGNYPVEIPAGRHTVTVTNPGADWIRIGYRFVALQERSDPPLIAWGIVGRTTAIAWIRHEEWTWREVVENGKRPAAVAPTVLTLPGLAPGRWSAELWNTWTGEIVGRPEIERAGKDARIALPAIDRDLAIRLRRQGD